LSHWINPYPSDEDAIRPGIVYPRYLVYHTSVFCYCSVICRKCPRNLRRTSSGQGEGRGPGCRAVRERLRRFACSEGVPDDFPAPGSRADQPGPAWTTVSIGKTNNHDGCSSLLVTAAKSSRHLTLCIGSVTGTHVF